MSDEQTKQRFYPLKPKNREGFKKAVAWLGGRELIASLKGVIIYAIYGENMDPRSWMKPNIYPNVEEKIKHQLEEEIKKEVREEIQNSQEELKELNSVIEAETASRMKDSAKIQEKIQSKVNYEWKKKIFDQWEWKRKHFGFWESYLKDKQFWENLERPDKSINEFWFDYIADTGDGQMGVYGVACMCFSDLWLTKDEIGAEVRFMPPQNESEMHSYTLLPRGSYLFVGGDTAYHSANYATLFERFQSPFRWAFMSARRFASKNYKLKKTESEKFFLLDGTRKDVFNPKTNEPIDEWDGTIGNYINGKLYWDTEPLRPLFGVPANHDYYDSIDGFNKQFRRPPFEEIEENMVYEDDKGRMFLQIPTFSREQEASYVALRLPFGWWMFGIDSENEKLDYRQELFFKQIMKRKPKKLILTTPEPTTVFGKISGKKDKTANYLKSITESLGLKQPFFTDGNFELLPPKKTKKNQSENVFEKQLESETENASPNADFAKGEKICRLDISGDVHHYARYWGENTRGFSDYDFASENYASLVAGGGGAFFDSTETLIGNTFNAKGKRIRRDGLDEEVKGEVPPQRVYPSEKASLDRMSDRLFDLWIIKKGGYVQSAGALFAIVIYFLLTHFSNASQRFLHIDGNVKANGLFYAFNQIENKSAFIFGTDNDIFRPFTAGFLLTAAVVSMFVCAHRLTELIKELKEKSFEETIDENVDGGIYQLFKKFIPFFLALGLYAAFIYYLPDKTNLALGIHPFTKSFFLFLHFILAGVLIWLSFDYSNWLPVRFKIARSYSQKTFSQIVEDPNEEAAEIYKQALGQLSREFSYRYVPAYLLVVLAIANLIFGIRTFGDESLSRTFGDLLLLVVVFGGLFLVSYKLAVGTGAAYQTGAGKRHFFCIGIFHAFLQLFTPFIVFYYANVWYLLFLTILVTVVNGFPVTSARIRNLPPGLKFFPKSFKRFYKVLDFQAAALLMKKGKKKLLTISWIVYGLLFLIIPLLLVKIFPSSKSLYHYVGVFTDWLLSFVNNSQNYNYRLWVLVILSVAVVGSLGYYLSRVWFSWYLAVSLAFNGHNNEAGGAARIEGFKHILRIKVENEKLTVYVIGFDDAEHELERLKLKLVDKFTLKTKPVL